MPNRNRKVKPVIAENIKTGEVLEFQSQFALARYFSNLYDIDTLEVQKWLAYKENRIVTRLAENKFD
jgi:hypothetical protein